MNPHLNTHLHTHHCPRPCIINKQVPSLFTYCNDMAAVALMQSASPFRSVCEEKRVRLSVRVGVCVLRASVSLRVLRDVSHPHPHPSLSTLTLHRRPRKAARIDPVMRRRRREGTERMAARQSKGGKGKKKQGKRVAKKYDGW